MTATTPPLVRISGAWIRLLDTWLDREGLAAPAIRAETARYAPEEIVPFEAWTRMLEAAAALRPDQPALGLDIGRGITPQHMGLVAYLLIASDNTGGAIEVFRRFVRLSYGLGLFTVHDDGDHTELQWPCEAMDSPGVILAHEVEIAAIATLYRNYIGEIPASARYAFQHQADATTLAAYQAFFRCQLSFGDVRRRIRFPASFMEESVQQPDPALYRLLERQAVAELENLPVGRPLDLEVQALIVDLLPKGEASIERVAALMNQVPRTLQRKLADAGLTWRRLMERTREKMAREYLADPRLSLAEISRRLGYADQSVFTRAFQRWTDTTPQAFRARTAKVQPHPAPPPVAGAASTPESEGTH